MFQAEIPESASTSDRSRPRAFRLVDIIEEKKIRKNAILGPFHFKHNVIYHIAIRVLFPRLPHLAWVREFAGGIVALHAIPAGCRLISSHA